MVVCALKHKKRKMLKKLFLIDDVQCIVNNYKNKWRTSTDLQDLNGACIRTKSMMKKLQHGFQLRGLN